MTIKTKIINTLERNKKIFSLSLKLYKIIKIFINKHDFLKALERIKGFIDKRTDEEIISQDIIINKKEGNPILLYVGIKQDYGYKTKGLSYEHFNYYKTLKNMEFSTIYFDYDNIFNKFGKIKTTRLLKKTIKKYNPNFLFYIHYLDFINQKLWKKLKYNEQIKTIILLIDDNWRYEETRKTWENFNYIITTYEEKLNQRKKEGRKNTIFIQYGANDKIYKKYNIPKKFDITFIGKNHSERKEFINKLSKKEINITCFGEGFSEGRISQKKMIKVMNESQISLNISFNKKTIQVKGRDFEVPACGSLLLTLNTPEINKLYIKNKEIITYKTEEDCIKKIKELLKNKEKIKRISEEGHKKFIEKYTVKKQMEKIFNKIKN